MYIIPPIVVTTITATLVSLIPKALSDAYDYLFNDEVIQVRKKADRTKISEENLTLILEEYEEFLQETHSTKTQKSFVLYIKKMYGVNKSFAQIMSICRSEVTK